MCLCVAYGSAATPPTGRTPSLPNFLCPVCLRKLSAIARPFDVVSRYRRMQQVWIAHRFLKPALWLHERLELVTQEYGGAPPALPPQVSSGCEDGRLKDHVSMQRHGAVGSAPDKHVHVASAPVRHVHVASAGSGGGRAAAEACRKQRSSRTTATGVTFRQQAAGQRAAPLDRSKLKLLKRRLKRR